MHESVSGGATDEEDPLSLSAFCVLLGLWELIIGLPLALRPAATGGWLEELLEQEHWLRLACFLRCS